MPICPSILPRKIDFYGFVPVKKNKKIRWKYPGELDWHEIEGDHYTLDKKEQYLDGIYEVLWQTVTQQLYFGTNTVFATYTSFSWARFRGKPRPDLGIGNIGRLYGGNYWDCAPSFISYEAQVKDNSVIKEIGSDSSFSDPSIFGVGVRKTCLGNTTGGDKFTGGNNKIISGEYTLIKRLDQPNPIISCLFKIYDKNNVILYEQSTEVCPQVEEIPESCDIDPDSRQFLGTFITNQFVIYEIVSTPGIASLKCSSVVAFITTLPGVPVGAGIPVIILCSPEDCDKYPLIQYICCDCEECPLNTCRVECGDTICCYDSSGNVVKSFSVQDANCQ